MDIVALVSVIGIVISGILTTCFHSRCTNIRTPCISCDRVLMDEQRPHVAQPVE